MAWPNGWSSCARDPSYADARRELEDLVRRDWDPDRCDQMRWESEERRLAIMKAGQALDWRRPSPPVPHPLRRGSGGAIDNVALD